MPTCGICDGVGYLVDEFGFTRTETCSQCDGKGKIGQKDCPECESRGKLIIYCWNCEGTGINDSHD